MTRPDPWPVVLLPGGVLPAQLAYGALLGTLGDDVDPRLKELEIYAGIRFYGDLLGLRETFRTPREGRPEHIEFAVGNGFRIGLGTVEAARRVHEVEAEPGSPAMVLVLWTNNVDRAYHQLVAAGVPAVQQPHDTGNGNRNALLRDPDGNLVEIVAKVS